MGYKLDKPCTDKQRMDFIVQYNHIQGLEIVEKENAFYAIYPWETIEGNTIVDNSEAYEQEKAQAEKERIARLSLTRGDVFRGLLLAKGITRAQIRSLLEGLPENTPEELITKELALIDFDEALNFYRGKEIIDAIGIRLGITSEQLDKFFETNDYTCLISPDDFVYENDDTEGTEDTEGAENTEVVEDPDNLEDAGNTEDINNVEDLENTDDTENVEGTEEYLPVEE